MTEQTTKPRRGRRPRSKLLPRAEAQRIIPQTEVQSPRPSPIPSPSENPELDSSGPSEDPEVLNTVIQSHEPNPQSLKSRLADKVRAIVSGEDNDEGPEDGSSRGAAYRSKKKQKEEVSNLILTIFVVGVSAWQVPEEVKPTRDELGVVSNHMTSILARHNLLLGKLSGDALDVVGIIAVGASWYGRVAPELRKMRGPGDGGNGRPPSGPQSPRPAPSSDQTATPEASGPIARADLATGQWLEDVLHRPEGSE